MSKQCYGTYSIRFGLYNKNLKKICLINMYQLLTIQKVLEIKLCLY